MHWIVIEITLVIMEKSWNCVFEFLWETFVLSIFEWPLYRFYCIFQLIKSYYKTIKSV